MPLISPEFSNTNRTELQLATGHRSLDVRRFVGDGQLGEGAGNAPERRETEQADQQNVPTQQVPGPVLVGTALGTLDRPGLDGLTADPATSKLLRGRG